MKIEQISEMKKRLAVADVLLKAIEITKNIDATTVVDSCRYDIVRHEGSGAPEILHEIIAAGKIAVIAKYTNEIEAIHFFDEPPRAVFGIPTPNWWSADFKDAGLALKAALPCYTEEDSSKAAAADAELQSSSLEDAAANTHCSDQSPGLREILLAAGEDTLDQQP